MAYKVVMLTLSMLDTETGDAKSILVFEDGHKHMGNNGDEDFTCEQAGVPGAILKRVLDTMAQDAVEFIRQGGMVVTSDELKASRPSNNN